MYQSIIDRSSFHSLPDMSNTPQERKRLERADQMDLKAASLDKHADMIRQIKADTAWSASIATEVLLQELVEKHKELNGNEDLAAELVRVALHARPLAAERMRNLRQSMVDRLQRYSGESTALREQAKKTREGRKRKAQEALASQGILDPDAEAREPVPADKQRNPVRAERPKIKLLDEGVVSSKRQRIEAPRTILSPEADVREPLTYSSDSE